MYRGRPTRPKKLKRIELSVRYVPPAPLSLADAASQLGIRPVEFAQAIREGKVATVRGRGGELLIAHEEMERAQAGLRLVTARDAVGSSGRAVR